MQMWGRENITKPKIWNEIPHQDTMIMVLE